MKQERGGFALGLIVGLLVGLALALAVALYVTKVPVPFVNKVPQRTAEQDAAEIEKNKAWDPNAPLVSKTPGAVAPTPQQAASAAKAVQAAADSIKPPTTSPAAPAASAAKPPKPPSTASTRDPAAILAGQDPIVAANPAKNAAGADGSGAVASTKAAVDPFVYFVQVGAFASQADAEQQRARVGLMGLKARISEREQAGRTMYRVRLGPFNKKEEADALQDRLAGDGLEAALVRVEK